ncbi:MAG: TetR/AcrR family transcriptional regulator [Acidobacteria bacterium]|nr:TetR/AcrR family transcriptional regulator [Acidobacteriota bacterium]
MPRKTEVPSRITRAAIALFSRQGYHGTSTRDIARLADVSEVTLFRYFEHKEDIFWAALASCFDSVQPRFNALELSSRKAAPEVVLPRILNILIDTATFSPELMRLVAVALLEVHGKAEEVCRQHLTPLFTAISSYLHKNVESGAIRNLNPAITTLGMALTVLAQPELSKLIDGCHISRLDLREVVDTYTQFWLGALLPSDKDHVQTEQTLPMELPA